MPNEINAIKVANTDYPLRDTSKLEKVTTSTTKDQFYTKTAAGGQTLTDVAVKNSTGKDSVINVTTYDEVDRTNTAAGPYSVAIGSRNTTSAAASESGAFGGEVHIDGENTYGFGYHVYGFHNQSLVGGYDIGANAKESLIFGHTLGIASSHNAEDHTWTRTTSVKAEIPRGMMVFGKDHVVGKSCQYLNISGSSITVGENVLNAIISGTGHTIGNNVLNAVVLGAGADIGNNVEYVTVLNGNANIIEDYFTDGAIIGYGNTVYGGTAEESKSDAYILGPYNKTGSTTTSYNNTWLIGAHLQANASNKVYVGRYNSTTNRPGTYFEVGTGGGSSSRRTSFAVGYNSTYKHHVYIGSTVLAESDGGLAVNGTTISLTGHTHGASAITSGTFAIARIPTGSSSTTSASYVVKCDDSRLSNARNAADVYAWAKASTKPSYTLDEVTDGTTRKLSDYALATHNHDSAYLGKTATAADSSKLNGQAASYYQAALPTTTTAGKVLKSTSTAGSVTWGDDSNTNTWRNVKVDGIEKLGTGTGTGSLNFISQTTNNGDISFTYDSGIKATAKLPTFATVATSGSYNDLSNKPSIPSKDSDITNDQYVRFDTSSQGLTSTQKSNARTNIGAGTSSFSGSYNDLTNKPTIPAAQVNSDWNATSGVAQILNKPTLATVATSGSYNDLSNKPTIPTVNNGTLTIQKNGSSVGTFSANQSGSTTINITVPTTPSDIGAATSGHTHSISLATSSGTPAITLSNSATYALTAGGQTVIFKTPAGGGGGSTLYRHNIEMVVKEGSSTSGYQYYHCYFYTINSSSTAITHSVFYGDKGENYIKYSLQGGYVDDQSTDRYYGRSMTWLPRWAPRDDVQRELLIAIRDVYDSVAESYISAASAYSFIDTVEAL